MSITITPNTKISEVIKGHPELIDVLIGQSANFSRLRNPVFRRVFPRLVTVAQAASMAGLDPAHLVRSLNAAIGGGEADVSNIDLGSMAGLPTPPWLDMARIATVLDVRDAQRSHQDPFSAIMEAVRSVPVGHIFKLVNTFEPLPLYDVLGKRGFLPWARKLGTEECEVFFFNAGREATGTAPALPSSPEEASGPSGADGVATTSGNEDLTIDVRDLVPPQPMMRIMDALERLQKGQVLVVHHVRRPVYLYPRLAEMGYVHETVEVGPNRVDIRIRKG